MFFDVQFFLQGIRMALSDAIEQLKQEEAAILERYNEAMKIVADSQVAISGVQQALIALGEKPAAKINSKAATPKSTKASKPAPSKVDVIELVTSALQERGVLEKDALKEAVQNRLGEAGKSRQGFALRFKEALADSRFVESPAGYRITEESHVEEVSDRQAIQPVS